MIVEGEYFIYVTIISSLFTLVGLVFWNHNKFKYAELKHNHSLNYMDAKDHIDARRFKRKQMAIVVPTAPEKSIVGSLGGIASLAPLLRGLDSDQIGALIDTFVGGGREEGEGEDRGGSMDLLLEFAEKNPEIVKGLLEGITKGVKGGGAKEEGGYQV